MGHIHVIVVQLTRQSMYVELAIVHHEPLAIAHNIENVLSVLCREPLRIFALQLCNGELMDPVSPLRNVVPWQEVLVIDLSSPTTYSNIAHIFGWQSTLKFDNGQFDDLSSLLVDILVGCFSIESVPCLLLECLHLHLLLLRLLCHGRP